MASQQQQAALPSSDGGQALRCQRLLYQHVLQVRT
jgi:hypothetical protein